LSAIDDLLIAGIRQGPAKKYEAINRIIELVPDWTRADCWRRIFQLRRASKLAVLECCHPNKAKKSGKTGTVRSPSGRPWTLEDDDKLFRLAGYEPVKKIARRLRRSVRAVRFRLGALGISAKVTDGWSLRELQKMLRVSRARLRYLIGTGMLKVRDPRISASSLAVLFNKSRMSLGSSTLEDDAYTWDRAANLLGVPVAQVQSWICAGQLQVVDTFVTDRSFEEFCKNHGQELKASMIDSPTAKWLASEYGVSEVAANDWSVSRARKHTLVIRTCNCGRKIAGNVYSRHLLACPSAGAAARADPSNTREPGSRRFPNVQSSKSM
jgi:hypothetical protein